MIDLKGRISIQFLKKSDFKGSYCGMRYRLSKVSTEEGERIQVEVWKGPKSYDRTEEEKEIRDFPFSAEGIEQAVSWMNDKYEEKKKIWEQVKYQ